ncbi:MAG: hypothetical protein BM562_07090 [Alphaproteobacteria bacterium MedPE-SWcel]|nr:MAG: hypothetical protein BM562_07090 [Alphaproteobacteria bacterium MedPE-SWcel]
MPQFQNARATAEAIGRITCIKTGEEIGLLYRWDNGETQAALYDGDILTELNRSDHPADSSIGTKRP